MIVARSQIPEAGFGLYATQDFPAGVLVTEYTGPEVNRDEALALRAAGKDQYIRSLKNGFCIDGNPFPALGEGCAQMANDGFPGWSVDCFVEPILTHSSQDGIPNNCEFILDTRRDKVQEKPRVYLRTLRAISSGEELLASYGRTYWDIHLASDDDDDDEDDDEDEEEDDGEQKEEAAGEKVADEVVVEKVVKPRKVVPASDLEEYVCLSW